MQNETGSEDASQVSCNEQISGTCNAIKKTAGQETSEFHDDWTEEDAEIPSGVTDTMLTATDFLDDNERQQIYNIAPGEGSVPLSIFRDKYSEELVLLVNRQMHRHCQTCRKKSKAECRFNFPQPPMKSTTILHPLGDDVSETEVRKHKDTWKNISKHLNDMKEGEDITFDQLLINLNVTEQNYYLAIQSSLNSPTIFLRMHRMAVVMYHLIMPRGLEILIHFLEQVDIEL